MLRNTLYIILVLLCCLSCRRGPEVGPDQIGSGITLFLSVAQEKEQVSKATPESDLTIDGTSVYVLIMSGNDASATLLDYGIATQIGSGQKATYHINLGERTEACYAYIVVNAKAILDAAAVGWVKNSTSLAEIGRQLQTDPLPRTGNVITAMPAAHPMVGSTALPDGISQSLSIGSIDNPLVLTPSTVKITVENRVASGAGYSFSLQGASLGNAPERGYVMPLQTGTIDTYLYGKEGQPASMMVGAAINDQNIEATEPLYGYESTADQQTFVVVKATYNGVQGYYKFGFFADADKTNKRPLLRGSHYRLTVFKVLTAGYRTVDEALSGPVSNGVTYLVNVNDSDSHDIITNGTQYLGVSNSEYVAYHSNYSNEFELYYTDGVYNNELSTFALTPFTASVLTYTADPSWGEGSVTASAGITLVDESLNKVPSIPLPVPALAGDAVRKELRIFMSNEFKNGQLDIRIGNLHKVVKIKRALSFTVMGGAVSLGRDIVFASARTLDNPMSAPYSIPPPCDPTTYGLAYSAKGPVVQTGDGRLAIDPSQELFLQIKNRFEWVNADYCYGELYLHRNTEAGRTKVAFTVDMRGCESIGDYAAKPEYAAASAFWRNDQKGERLIQLIQNSWKSYEIPRCGRWQARVLAGADFIQLGDWDEGLTVTANRYDGDPEQRSIAEPKEMVCGKDILVRFRIALTSTNVGNPNRYGLIQVTYTDKRHNYQNLSELKVSCFIFVRQGETAEPVLTPGKTYPGGSYITQPFVAPDVRFSPYALIDPLLGPGGNTLADHTPITETVRPVFAPYPSYTDYLFQWSGDRMFHPTNPLAFAPNEWPMEAHATEFKELCPKGYITPPSQIEGIDTYYGLCCNANGFGSGNSYEGYCADGHLDRWIQYKEATAELVNYAPHAQSIADVYRSGELQTGSSGTGGLGKVYFNPETMASVYFPPSINRAGHAVSGSFLIDRNALTTRTRYYYSMWSSFCDPSDPLAAQQIGLHGGYNGPKGYAPFILSANEDKFPFPTILYCKPSGTRIRCIKDPATH